MDSPDSVTGYRDHRRKPELNINTSASAGNLRSRDRERERERERDRERDRDSMPQTPPDRVPPAPSKGKGTSASGGRALRVPTSTTRDAADMESFLESLTPVDVPMPMPMLNSPRDKINDRPDPRSNPRDSHDLSLSPRQVTRDSLVANMLLSLDQLSMGQIDGSFGGGGGSGPRTNYGESTYSYGDDDRRAMTFSNFSSRTTRPNTNGHGYSYSSDLEGADDASRVSSQPSRGRRSNSSSGFQSSLGRINSMREVSHQRSIPGTPRHLHSRGRKGSKSSSTNSIDAGYAQVLSSQRWARGIGGRSSSFDYGETRSTTAPPTGTATMSSQSPWHIEFSKSFFDNNNDEYEAAPTPTVPGGPRRLATVPSMPVMPPPEPKSPKLSSLERRRSTRSSKSATVGRKSDPKHKDARDAPPMPAFELDSAPAPLVGYEKSKEAIAAPATQPKEKQGFFRRMFGSSKTSFLGGSSSPQPSPASIDTSASRAGSQSKPPSRDSQHQHGAAHTLQKKTSSFFRRRKQSISDAEPPPIPTVPAVPPTNKLPIPKFDANPPKPEPSPVTSLRRAMDPFLQNSPTTPTRATPGSHPLASFEPAPDSSPAGDTRPSTPPPNGSDTERRRHTRGFSPDYTPDPKAVIRPVRPDSADEAEVMGPPLINTPSRQPPEPPAQSPPRSFLQDNSDSEDSPKRLRKPQPTPVRNEGGLKPVMESDKRRRSPSPTVSKSKSSPNLGRSREELRASMRADSKLSPSSSQFNESRDSNNLGLPIEGTEGSIHKAGSRLPSLNIVSAEPSPSGPRTGDSLNHSGDSIDEPHFVIGDPTEDDRQKAKKIFDGDEEYLSRDRAAAWMGEEGTVRQRTLRAYMDLYDFENQTIVSSLRSLCQRLLLRAETQQVDRILVAFSKRWCDCNPNHGFKTSDVIHTICYSIILLNTDLHMADIEHKMTRSQFIKNTMTTIRQAVEDSIPEAYERPSILPGRGSILGEPDGRTSLEHEYRHNSFRASFKPPPRPGSALGMFSDRQADHHETSGPLVRAPFEGSIRGWESQVEMVLKDIYSSIRDDCLPLFGGAEQSLHPNPNGLSVMGMLKRSPSVLSKAPSEGVTSTRGRIPESIKANSSRWNSKSRSRPRGFGTGFSSSRTSFDDGTSVWSPTESSATWSKASLGRTHTSMSMDSFGSSYPRGDYHQSIGFANALSQAIIREDNTLDTPPRTEEMKSEQMMEDDSLELAGPPWIKEGIVTHKHHLDGIDKRAKDRNWTEVFAVIQKGTLSLFSFAPNKSMRNKGRLRGHLGGGIAKGAVVGGGNWQENATNLGTFSLRQTLASALPPPGYSRSRPHVWALSLPTGAVHLFQVGTPEISKEFVSTANYWGARLSTHPLVGGVSNIEYGWSDAIINNALVNAINDSNSNLPARPGTSMSNRKGGHSRPGSDANAAAVVASMGRSSMQSRSSMRSSSFDFALNRPGSGSSGVLGNIGAATLPSRHGHGHGHKLPGDRIHIAEWTPPTQSMRPSNFSEQEQREALLNYVRTIEEELTAHNQLRSPMLLAFTPRSSNAVKAMANWERKSEYLLREIVKFRTYVDCLSAAGQRKAEIYAERETARRALRGEDVESDHEEHDEEGDATILEDDIAEEEKKEEEDMGKGKGIEKDAVVEVTSSLVAA
ncbi:hypothetical protein QBC37DRAFT_380330 [Rhypophila decipiens]|uniref:SEC7 domain-containing protein n=1 Tax=Rhypophila decipiens TaxID=261697 RepID=A0AAN6XV48_9PEZI|nr:hypothetical protein QBC37DRAFT_380330 [Rhypophila decipiens]